MRFTWLSDPHFQARGDVLGKDPRACLRRAISHVNTHLSESEFCLITGDMVNRGTRVDYDALAEELKALSIPVLPLMGNHDQRDLFRQFLPLPPSAMTDFIQYDVSIGQFALICLDTHRPGADAGELCGARLDWLNDKLADYKDHQVILAMHHPPLKLGLPMQDEDNLLNGSDLLDLIQQHSCVSYLLFGHVHRMISGTVRGIPYATINSITYQAPPPEPAWTWETFAPADEAPHLGLVEVTGPDVTLQYRQI